MAPVVVWSMTLASALVQAAFFVRLALVRTESGRGRLLWNAAFVAGCLWLLGLAWYRRDPLLGLAQLALVSWGTLRVWRTMTEKPETPTRG